MELVFDFKEELSGIFGKILRPVAYVVLINGDIKVPEYVYVDSGADITLISKSVGEILGFKVSDNDKIEEIKGIGERSVPLVIKSINMQIGEKVFQTRIGWALIEEVPLLLGRIEVFSFFDICFQKNEKTFFRH